MRIHRKTRNEMVEAFASMTFSEVRAALREKETGHRPAPSKRSLKRLKRRFDRRRCL